MRDYGTIFLAIILGGLAAVVLGLTLVTVRWELRAMQRPVLGVIGLTAATASAPAPAVRPPALVSRIRSSPAVPAPS
jgi:hypothetical protein